MRRTYFVISSLTFFAVSLGLAGCQRAVLIESGQAQEMLQTWRNNGNKLIEMAQEFPEDKYDYRPTPEVRTFGEIIRHIAAVNFRYVRQAQQKPYYPEEFALENFPGKDDLVSLLAKSYQEGAELIQPLSDAQMIEAVKSPYDDSTTSRYAYWMQAVEHAAEHYGNLVVYYRLNGLVPPASRSQGQ